MSELLTASEALWYLIDVGLDSRVRDERLEKLREIGKLMRWGHRAAISNGGADQVTVLLSGGVDIDDGHHRKPLRLGAGDLYGSTEGAPDEIRLRAYDDTLVCNVSRDDFEELAGEDLGAFETRAGLRPRVDLSVPVEELLYRPASARMAHALLRIADQLGNGQELEVRLKPRHLASLAGIAPARSRALYDAFQKENLIEVTSNGLVIPDLETVRMLANKGRAS